MSLKTGPRLHIFQAELADEYAGQRDQLDGVRGEVPGLDAMSP